MQAFPLAPDRPVPVEQPVVRACPARALLTLFVAVPVAGFVMALRVDFRRECDHLSVRRPDDVVGPAWKIGQFDRFAIAVDVQDVDLSRVASRGQNATRRPSGENLAPESFPDEVSARRSPVFIDTIQIERSSLFPARSGTATVYTARLPSGDS